MAGKHRGESRKGKAAGITRYTLDKESFERLQSLAKIERRSVANMISVLVAEVLEHRNRGMK